MPRSKKQKAGLSVAARVIEAMRKELKDPEVGALSDYGEVKEVMPTGIEVLDRWVLGIGGLPYGRMVEVSGPGDVGKTTFMGRLIAAAQADGALADLGDAEGKLHPGWIEVQGANLRDVVMLPAPSVEEWLGAAIATVEKFPRLKHAMFLDSVATLSCEAVLKKEADDKKAQMAANAAAWSTGLRRLKNAIRDRLVIVVLVNQIRNRPGVVYGPDEYTPGGNAMIHYPSIKLQLGFSAHVKDGERTVAKWVRMRASKNHFVFEHRKAKVLLTDRGFDSDQSTLAHAIEMGCVEKTCRDVALARANLGWG